MEGGLDIFQILLESGIIVKIVLALLVLCSVLSWAIIFQKRKFLQTTAQSDLNFLRNFNQLSSLAEIQKEADAYQLSSMSLLFTTGFGELEKIKEKLLKVEREEDLSSYLSAHGIVALERSLKKAANKAGEKLDKHLSVLASIGSISPFIGLFGTVWGIIDSFAALASGGGNIEAVAPGIAEALVATAVGLAAAIPAVWAYNYFSAQVSEQVGQMENFGQDFLNLVERNILIKK